MSDDLRYELVIRWSADDHAYLASAPELPGCIADGATYSEAVKNAEELMRVWIETARELGRPIPVPKAAMSSSSTR